MRDLEAEFREFHAANPHVYDLFDRFTQQVISRGFDRYSADAILHRVRWHTTIETTDDEGFKINNNWAAFYSPPVDGAQPAVRGVLRDAGAEVSPDRLPPQADANGQFPLF